MNDPARGPKRAKRTLASALVVITLITTAGVMAARLARRLVQCDYIDDAPVWSPDGKWVVTSTTKACPAGPLSSTNYEVFVTLKDKLAAGSPVPTPLHIFESDDAGEPPNLTWTSPNDLRLQLKEPGAVRTSKHEIENIRIKYVVPKCIWDRLGSIEFDRLQEDRQSEELFKAGKMSSKDLRLSLESSAALAQERTAFRQWILENATVEESPP